MLFLSGHTGLPNARLLTDLDKLQEGDQFYIHVLDEILAYEVDQIKVVERMISVIFSLKREKIM